MISPSSRLLRRFVAPALATLSFASTIVAPVLDAEEQNHVAVLESKHDASTCVRGHDHTVCTQVVANASATTGFARHRLDTVAYRVGPQPLTERLSHSAAFFLPLGSRAPPLA